MFPKFTYFKNEITLIIIIFSGCTDTCTIEAPTVPKQIDRGTACPLGRGPEVLCGVRLIIIIIIFSGFY